MASSFSNFKSASLRLKSFFSAALIKMAIAVIKSNFNSLHALMAFLSSVATIAPFFCNASVIASASPKSILKSSLGFTPQVQGTRIIVKIPSLSQEQRQKLIKLINEKAEGKKEIIRNHRDDIRKRIKTYFEKDTL